MSGLSTSSWASASSTTIRRRSLACRPASRASGRPFPYALKAFSDFHHEINDQYADGDRVITRITGYGKHTGEFLGIPPSGKDVKMEGIAVHRIVDGKLVEHWAQIDALGLLIQLGAVPPPGQSA